MEFRSKQSLIVVTVMQLVLQISLFAAAVKLPVVSISDPSVEKALIGGATTAKDLVSAIMLADGFEVGRYDAHLFDGALDGLDYTTSRSFRLAIPNTRYEVVIDWGFPGSGEHNLELMLPLPSVPLKLEINEEASVAVPGKDSAFTQFGKIVMENELRKLARGNDGDVRAVLAQFGINPVLKPRAVFLLKLALLVQHAVKTQDFKFFTNELGFLLCRFVLSGDIDMQKAESLTEMLPASVVQTINTQAPGLVDVLNKMFINLRKLFRGTGCSQEQLGNKTFIYVFSQNKLQADSLAAYAATVLDKEDVELLVEDHLKTAGITLVDWDDFFEMQKDAVTDVRSPLSFVAGKIVAYGNDYSEVQQLGLLSDSEILEVTAMLSGFKVYEKKRFSLVVCRTSKAFLDFSQTFSAVAASVAKAWASYVALVRQEVARGNDPDVTELLLEGREERDLLRNFFKSERGQELNDRLNKAVLIARTPFEKLEKRREELDGVLADLEERQAAIARELDQKRYALEGLSRRTDVARCAEMIADLEQSIASLSKENEALGQRYADNEALLEELEARIKADPVGVKKMQLDRLMTVIQRQGRVNAVDPDVRAMIVTLNRELEVAAEKEAAARESEALTPDERLELRDAVIVVHEEEIEAVTEELEALNASQDLSAATLTQIAQFEVYKKYLDIRLKKMKAQQDDLQRLVKFRIAVKDGATLSTVKAEEFYNLEQSLGFILDATDVAVMCRVTKPKRSFADRFIQELSQPTAGSVFVPMHNQFVDDIAVIIARSSVARENEPLVRYFLSLVFPLAQQKVVNKILAA